MYLFSDFGANSKRNWFEIHFFANSAVVISLRYGYYGDYRMLLGPCSSRLFKANSVFVKQVEVRDNGRKGLILYEFSRKPDLNLEENWSVTNYVIIKSYSRKVKLVKILQF